MGHFQIKAIELKSEQGIDYVEGFISTTDPDLYDDVVNENAQKSILKQLQDRVIKLDFDHNKFIDPETKERYYEEKNFIPPGKIVSAELRKTDNGSQGVWAKIELNKDFEWYTNLKNSIKKGFLDAFSIGYVVTKTIPNKLFRVIDDLIIRNVAITGDPVNRNSRINQIALKSLSSKMSEENNQNNYSSEELIELKSVHEKLKTEFDEINAQLEEFKAVDYKAMCEELKAENDKLKSELENMKKSKKEEVKSLENSQKEMIELKSTLESRDVELKSLKEKIEMYENEPQLKSFIEVKSAVNKELFGENDQVNLWRLQ